MLLRRVFAHLDKPARPDAVPFGGLGKSAVKTLLLGAPLQPAASAMRWCSCDDLRAAKACVERPVGQSARLQTESPIRSMTERLETFMTMTPLRRGMLSAVVAVLLGVVSFLVEEPSRVVVRLGLLAFGVAVGATLGSIGARAIRSGSSRHGSPPRRRGLRGRLHSAECWEAFSRPCC